MFKSFTDFFDSWSSPFSIGSDIYNAIMSKKAFDYNKEMSDKYFDLNKQNQEFNQNLANRQQDLSEESYRNGIVNEANQLRSLGINPASQGGSISGTTMQGGSNVGSAGSASSINPAEAMSTLASIMMQKQSIKNQKEYNDNMVDIARYNAETDRINAETGKARQESDAGVNQATIDMYKARVKEIFSNIGLNDKQIEKMSAEIANINSQTDWQNLLNDDKSFTMMKLHKMGVSSELIQSLAGMDWKTAVAVGLAQVILGVQATNAENASALDIGNINASDSELYSAVKPVISDVSNIVQNPMVEQGLSQR